MVGYLASSLIAIPIGVLCGAIPRVEAALEPIMDFIRYMPVVAFVPLTILWVGTNDSQKFLIIFLGTFFQQVLMFADAVRRVPVEYRNLGATLGHGPVKILTRIVFPAACPGSGTPCASAWAGPGPGSWWPSWSPPPRAWATASPRPSDSSRPT